MTLNCKKSLRSLHTEYNGVFLLCCPQGLARIIVYARDCDRITSWNWKQFCSLISTSFPVSLQRSLAFDSCATNSRNCTNCATTNVFDNSQEDMCSRHGEIEMVRAMAEGVLDSLRQCQSNFKDTQWNCTTFNGEHLFGQFTECGRLSRRNLCN